MKNIISFILRLIASFAVFFVCVVNMDNCSLSVLLFTLGICAFIAVGGFWVAKIIDEELRD